MPLPFILFPQCLIGYRPVTDHSCLGGERSAVAIAKIRTGRKSEDRPITAMSDLNAHCSSSLLVGFPRRCDGGDGASVGCQ